MAPSPESSPVSPSRWSLWSESSVLSIASKGSFLSIGSIGSAFSIGSIGSFFSAFSIGSAGSLFSALSSQVTLVDPVPSCPPVDHGKRARSGPGPARLELRP